MSEKQDRQGVRTAQDLERKYGFGRTFAEIEGIATDARDIATRTEEELDYKYTYVLREQDRIEQEVGEKYVDKDGFEREVSTQIKQESDRITNTFNQKIEDANGNIKEIKSHIVMSEGKLTFMVDGSPVTLSLNQGKIEFANAGNPTARWDGNYFYTGNMVVKADERAQLGSFAFIPRGDGSLMFLKVGDKSGNS